MFGKKKVKFETSAEKIGELITHYLDAMRDTSRVNIHIRWYREGDKWTIDMNWEE